MHSPLKKAPGRRSRGQTIALWAGVAVGGVLPMIGCQAEYAGMTLPSGKYMYDDVQYFPPGPDFPWANTQAATQRARMQAMGMDVSGMPVPGQTGPVQMPPPAQGATPAGNINQSGTMVPNTNEMLNQPGGNPNPAANPNAPGNPNPPGDPNAGDNKPAPPPPPPGDAGGGGSDIPR